MAEIHHLHHKISEGEAKELILDSYVMYVHTHTCTNCECGERFSQLFEVWAHPTKTRTTGFRDLRPAGRIDRSLQISYIELARQSIPICSDCVAQYETTESERPAVSREAWAATLKRKYTPPASPVKKSTPAVPTLDDL